jgi:redox-sensitive bicupin YhaK (pirin superfamily)
MVGPFIFFDEMGPEIMTERNALDVAPHPHIGLATVTYLFHGEILHRDGLGTVQLITPGAVNWMTAGSGIAHSERTPDSARKSGAHLFGIQTWVALPVDDEETAPSFSHYEASELPIIDAEGKQARVIVGSLYGERSPVNVFSEMFYVDVLIGKAGKLPIPAEHEERAVYVVEGSVEFLPNDGAFVAGQLVILKPRQETTVSCMSETARVMLFGGESMPEKRHIWWNFVSSSKERIEQAKDDWREGHFTPVPDETEFIPLPADSRPGVVRYP